jgi:hypothetical protein
MRFDGRFAVVEQIQLLQRWILVQSFAYYELDNNVTSDFVYDSNALQLAALMKIYPEEARQSRYFEYFQDWAGGSGGDAHYTSGFDLLERVRKKDKQLYRFLHMDAAAALDTKGRLRNM